MRAHTVTRLQINSVEDPVRSRKNRYRLLSRLFMAVLMAVTLSLATVSCTKTAEPVQKQYTIGLVTNNPNGLRNIQGFRDGLSKLGYEEGRNVTYLSPGQPVKGADLDKYLANLVDRKVDLIFTAGTPTGIAAHKVAKSSGTPVVFGVIADPVKAGVLEDLNQPGGNITGVKLSDIHDKRFEYLLEISPGVRTVLVPYNPEDPAPVGAVEQIRQVAKANNIQLLEIEVRSSEEAFKLLSEFPAGVDAVFLVPDSIINPMLKDILVETDKRKIPVTGPSLIQVEKGALFTYGFVHSKAGAQAARIASEILKGIEPGQIPVETAEFFLSVNLVNASKLEIEIPYNVLSQAEVIFRDEGEGK